MDFLDDDDLVIGFKVGNDVRVYFYFILDWYEIINDDFGDFRVVIIYCLLIGIGIGWDCDLDGNIIIFGVFGLLYNINLIFYDWVIDSNWF